jgi:predicted O-methyltransferase YrrM
MNLYLEKMLKGIGDIQKYSYSSAPCHFNSLGLTKSITWEVGILLKNFVEWHKPKNIVEIGTFRGYSTAWLVLGALLNENGYVTTFDIQAEGFFGQMWYDYYELPKDKLFFKEIPGGVWEHDSLIPKTIDLLFHDSSHELDDTIKEMDCLLPRMAPKSVMLFDDMTHPDYAPMQGYLHSLFLSMPNWKWLILPIGTGLGIATRLQ